MSDSRNGEVEIFLCLTTGDEISQESPHRRGQLMRRFGAVLTCAIQQKRANALGIPSANIFAERQEQIDGSASIQPESRLGGSTMNPKPVAESSYQSGLIVLTFIGMMSLTYPAPDQMPVKELHSAAWMSACPFGGKPRAATM